MVANALNIKIGTIRANKNEYFKGAVFLTGISEIGNDHKDSVEAI